MKKFLFFAASAALMFASCSNDVDFSQADLQKAAEDAPTPVQFGTYVGQSLSTRAVGDDAVAISYTKGTIADATDVTKGTTALSAARFGVFSYYTQNTGYDSWSASTKAPNFMYNEEMKYDNTASVWYYDNVKYWPNGEDGNGTASTTAQQKQAGYLSFFAFAPYAAATSTDYTGTAPTGVTAKTTSNTKGVVAISSNTSTSDVWVKYEMGSDASESEVVDLLWGTRSATAYNLAKGTETVPDADANGNRYNTDLTKQKTTEKVNFVFKHALAKIGGTTVSGSESLDETPAFSGFKVVVDVDGNSATPKENGIDKQSTYFASGFDNTKTLVTLKEVKIQDGKSISDDTNISWVTGQTSNLNTSGWFDIEKGTWSDTGVGTAGATYNITANSTDAVLTNDTYTLNKDIKEPSSVSNPSGTWSISGTSGVTTTPKPVFCNEKVPSLLVIPGATADLYITVTYVVRTADTKLNNGYTEVEQTITNKISLASLTPNKFYSIIMHLGLTSVKFSAEVSNWTIDGDTDGNGEINGTETDGSMTEIWLPSNVIGS